MSEQGANSSTAGIDLPPINKSKVIVKNFGRVQGFSVNTHKGTVNIANEDRVAILLNGQERWVLKPMNKSIFINSNLWKEIFLFFFDSARNSKKSIFPLFKNFRKSAIFYFKSDYLRLRRHLMFHWKVLIYLSFSSFFRSLNFSKIRSSQG